MKATLITSYIHLGDTVGAFLEAQYAGLTFELPFTVTWVDDEATEFEIYVDTKFVETWGGWKGHPVTLQGIEVGRVLDSNDTNGASESTKILVAKSDFPAVFVEGAQVRIGISLEKSGITPGHLDDFVLLGFSLGKFSGRPGW